MNLKEFEEKYNQVSLKLSKSEAGLRAAQELLRKPHPNPVPEESKSYEAAEVPITQPFLAAPNFEDDS
jgi:hypothetical protein